MLWNSGDRTLQESAIESRYPAREVVADVYKFQRSCEGDLIELTQQEIKEKLNLQISAEFFFSSRRRHTRLTCDWSSDVCSSDLGRPARGRRRRPVRDLAHLPRPAHRQGPRRAGVLRGDLRIRHELRGVPAADPAVRHPRRGVRLDRKSVV